MRIQYPKITGNNHAITTAFVELDSALLVACAASLIVGQDGVFREVVTFDSSIIGLWSSYDQVLVGTSSKQLWLYPLSRLLSAPTPTPAPTLAVSYATVPRKPSAACWLSADELLVATRFGDIFRMPQSGTLELIDADAAAAAAAEAAAAAYREAVRAQRKAAEAAKAAGEPAPALPPAPLGMEVPSELTDCVASHVSLVTALAAVPAHAGCYVSADRDERVVVRTADRELTPCHGLAGAVVGLGADADGVVAVDSLGNVCRWNLQGHILTRGRICGPEGFVQTAHVGAGVVRAAVSDISRTAPPTRARVVEAIVSATEVTITGETLCPAGTYAVAVSGTYFSVAGAEGGAVVPPLPLPAVAPAPVDLLQGDSIEKEHEEMIRSN